MKRNTLKLFALILCVVIVSSLFSACKLTDPSEENLADKLFGLKIVMSSKNVDITMYDFLQSFNNNDYYQYYMYGLISQDDYLNMIVNDMSTFMYLVNAAYDEGFELTAEENEEINKSVSDQFERLLARYETQVTDTSADKRAEALKLFEADIASYGVDYNSAVELTVKSMCMYKIAEKYYNSITESIEVCDEEVEQYYKDRFTDEKKNTVSDFSELLRAYYSGNSPYPVHVPEDCFSVNHLYLELENEAEDEQNPVYNKDSRKDVEEQIEAKLPETDGFDGFMELVAEFGEDPGMTYDGYRENGYVIHPSMDDYYFPGFVYAAMNLHDGEWTPAEDADYEIPELNYFELKDGTKVVKVYTKSGVHYIILNKEYTKGKVEYEKGDEKWLSWKNAAISSVSEKRFEELFDSWKEKYEINTDLDAIKAIIFKDDGGEPAVG
ncbi:MAG: hypothetical protein K6F68_03125 [Clostridiales bacterium]|nr:hypothetical protein [Clostridiales bacterium]